MSRRIYRIPIALALCLPPLLLLWPGIFFQTLLPPDMLPSIPPWKAITNASPPQWNALIWDSIGQYYPWRTFAAQAFQSGCIPLWNPYQFSGTPFLANGQSALLYPLNLIFWLFDTRRAFGVSAFLHLVLAGWFSYLFLRALRMRRLAAVIGAEAFALNGYFITWIYLPTVLNSAVWFPLALLCAEKYFRKKRLSYAAAAGAAVGISALAGHPQIFLMCAFFFGVYFLLRGLFARQWKNVIIGTVTIGIFAALISIVQLLPLIELLRFSHRAGGGPNVYHDFYLAWALPWQNIITLIAPDFFGNPMVGTFWGKNNYAEYCAYIGIIPLILAGIAARYCRGFHARFFLIAALFWLLCAFGTALNWPLYHFVPGFSHAGSPARLLMLYLFSVAFLAGLGANWIILAYECKPIPWLRTRMLIIILIFAICAVAVNFIVKNGFSEVVDFTFAEAFEDARFNIVLMGILCVAALALIFLIRPKQQTRHLLGAVLFALVVVDLLLFGYRYIRFSPPEQVYPVTGGIRFLQKHAGNNRILALSPDPLEKAWPPSDLPQPLYMLRGVRPLPQALFPPNAAMVYSLRDILGYDSLYLAEYRALLGQLEGRDPSPAANGNLLLASNVRRDLLPKFGVRYLMSQNELLGKDLRLVYDGEMKIYEVLGNPTRAWAAAQGFKPEDGTVQITDDGLNRVGIKATLPAAGILVLADTFYPGWQADIDGQEVEIQRVNNIFRTVPLPAGESQVTFRFSPASFKIGLFALLTAIAFSVGWFISASYRRRTTP